MFHYSYGLLAELPPGNSSPTLVGAGMSMAAGNLAPKAGLTIGGVAMTSGAGAVAPVSTSNPSVQGAPMLAAAGLLSPVTGAGGGFRMTSRSIGAFPASPLTGAPGLLAAAAPFGQAIAPPLASAAMSSGAGAFARAIGRPGAGAGMTAGAGALSVPASGYNNLTNWPSLANRPVATGSVLSWIGPVGGGPSTASDATQSRTLTSSSGVTTTAPNQVIAGLDIQGQVNILHSGCKLMQCRVRFLNVNFGPVELGAGPAVTGVTIEDCEIDGLSVDGSSNNSNAGICSSNGILDAVTIRRNNIHSIQNGINQKYSNGCLIIDNFLWGWYGSDCDGIEVDTPTDSLTIKHCYFKGPVTLGFLNSGITPVNFPSGNITNMTIDNCGFENQGVFVGIIDDTQFSSGTLSINMTNNGFYFTGGQAFRRGNATTPLNSGNFVMATAGALTGALCNGTGVI